MTNLDIELAEAATDVATFAVKHKSVIIRHLSFAQAQEFIKRLHRYLAVMQLLSEAVKKESEGN